jgi:serine/threonine protein kinase
MGLGGEPLRRPIIGRMSDREIVGPFRLERKLGEGAMGVVWLARRGSEPVALKVLRPALAGNDVYVQRFLREARVAAEVRHRHLVPILEAGEAEGIYFLASAYVDGGSLAERLERERHLAAADAVRVAGHLAAALDALHEHGIVHRDVKPENVMLAADGAALTDFGLAKGDAYTVLTRPGEIMGTLDYIAPELISGGEASPASDVYALGCLVYECLTGAPPFAARGLFQVAVAHLEEEPRDPREANPDVPPSVSWAVLQALAKDPAERPTTATALANLLRAGAR